MPGERVRTIPMFDLGMADTAYPYLLSLSQAETERILAEHLDSKGTTVSRGTELVALQQHPDSVQATLRQRLGVEAGQPALILVRPDGYIGYLSHSSQLTPMLSYLDRWIPPHAA